MPNTIDQEVARREMDMTKPEPAYSGRDPYVFVSYSHSDRELIYPEIRSLQDEGFNVWYDEGITIGAEWTETLANAISRCFNFLYFITPNSVRSGLREGLGRGETHG